MATLHTGQTNKDKSIKEITKENENKEIRQQPTDKCVQAFKKEKIVQQSTTSKENKVQDESYDIEIVHKTG